MWHKAVWMGLPLRLKLIREGLLVKASKTSKIVIFRSIRKKKFSFKHICVTPTLPRLHVILDYNCEIPINFFFFSISNSFYFMI